MFEELDKMFPAGSVDLTIHHISEKNIPKKEFKRIPDLSGVLSKIYTDKTRESIGFGITIFTEDTKDGDELKEEK